MYTFKPLVFTEHSSSSVTRPEEIRDHHPFIIHCDDKNVYAHNGDFLESLTQTGIPNIWVYNLARQQWRLIRDEINLPNDGDFILSIFFESNHLYIFTIKRPYGYNVNPNRTCRIYIYDLNTKSVVIRETSGQIPYPLLPLEMIRHGNYFYIVGITDDLGESSNVYRLNMENGIWEAFYTCEELDNEYSSIPRSRYTLVYGNNIIYKFGDNLQVLGFDLYSFVSISAFDLEKCRWKIVDTHGDENHIPQYPTKREKYSVTSYTDPVTGEINVIMSGGADYSWRDAYDHFEDTLLPEQKFVVAYNDVWRLNLTSLKWTCLDKFGIVLPHCVENHSMAISPAGKLFTFGKSIFNDRNQRITTSSLHSAWLRIPKLTDICWEAIFYYYPNLKSMTDKEITSLGIPLKLFKSRID
ncbi:kelch domain-containing protein 10 homolog [Microplitis mediator]|uniref:kelch domain-containing protein 10 homolog n=1 Tax=Microplitis mediator TaxID=375433 RepID=UPI0025533D4C|nr:kelch domain-containing protein 10 homolog [Microplitis mediator]